MSLREGLLLLLLVLAAGVAAFSVSLETTAAGIYGERYAARYEETRKRLPSLGAVRIRSARSDAEFVLRTRGGAKLHHLSGPGGASVRLRGGRFLYWSESELRQVVDRLKSRRAPERLPVLPEFGDLFVDGGGRYACEVVPEGEAGLERLRSLLPAARLSGEPIAREEERKNRAPLFRALLAAALVGSLVGGLRGRSVLEGERRLLAAVSGMALLGATGLGVDPWTVAAVALVAGAPRGAPLAAGGVAAFFPAAALQRMGLVFLVGGVVRWSVPRAGEPDAVAAKGAAVRPWAVVALVLLGGVLVWPLGPPVVNRSVALEPAARVISEAGTEGDGTHAERATDPRSFLPPPVSATKAKLVHEIFVRANRLAAIGPEEQRSKFEETAACARREKVEVPPGIRARVQTTDGAPVAWRAPVDLSRADAAPAFTGASLYRARGSLALRRAARWAALTVFLAAGLGLWAFRARIVPRATIVAGLLAGGAALLLWEGSGAPSEACLPAVALAPFCAAWAAGAALCLAAVWLPSLLAGPAVALVCALLLGAWARRRVASGASP